jgi:hypothetical protein
MEDLANRICTAIRAVEIVPSSSWNDLPIVWEEAAVNLKEQTDGNGDKEVR